MSDLDTICAGREAWQRIKDRDKASFEDWLMIGRALIAGRTECMSKAGCNKPYGPAYQRRMRVWLDDNGLAEIDSHERVNAIHCVEHQVEIEAWRDSLTEVQRRRANHPNTIIAHWRRRTVPQKTGPKPATFQHHPRADARPIYWEQDYLRRAASALRECRSTDVIVLARAVLEAAVRSEADVYPLLEQSHRPKPAKMRAPVVAEAVA